MVTIKELAKASGVSIATVSNVLNGTGRVGKDTTEKVLRIAKELGYVPNMIAKNLKQGNKKTIGIITEDITVFNAVGVVDGINEYLDELGYTFLLGNLRLYQKYGNAFYHHEDYTQQVNNAFQMMLAKQVSGIIYVGAHCRAIHCVPENLNVPVVMAYCYDEKHNFPAVVFDDEMGGYEVAKRFLENGQDNFGVITGDVDSEHTKARLAGVKRAVDEFSKAFGEAFTTADSIIADSNIVKGDWTRESGYNGCKVLYEAGCTSIFCMSDIMAGGAYDYAQEKGLRIGEDIKLIGFDDREIATAFSPALSTMALPLSEIGKKSAEELIKILENEKEDTVSSIFKLECRFIERESHF